MSATLDLPKITFQLGYSSGYFTCTVLFNDKREGFLQERNGSQRYQFNTVEQIVEEIQKQFQFQTVEFKEKWTPFRGYFRRSVFQTSSILKQEGNPQTDKTPSSNSSTNEASANANQSVQSQLNPISLPLDWKANPEK